MARTAFADESGTDARCTCYAIGVVSIGSRDRANFDGKIVELKASHGIVGEAKWTRVRNSHGAINFVLDCLALVLNWPSAAFDVIVVNKGLYNNWQGDSARRETAFYKTYAFLIRHIVQRAKETAEVLIDERSDRYAKHDEAMLTIGNRMLVRLAAKGTLGAIRKAASHDTPGIQLADVLTGAINTAHLLRIQTFAIHPGKHLVLERLAQQLGWDHLGYDTYPHAKFNVWHFPIEFRGPSRNPLPSGVVPYVSAADLLARQQGAALDNRRR